MRINSIILRNYRQFKDTQIRFLKCGQNELFILLGTNGAGKTNLLNAINWCLYNNEPHLGDKSRAIPIPNSDSLNGVLPGSTIEVKVEINCEEESGPISFTRTSKFRITENNNTPFEILSEFKVTTTFNGEGTKIYENAECDKFLNHFVPLSIREYFFFDGERLDKYFISESSTKIKDSIYEISQINLLRNISNKLDTVIKDLLREITRAKPDIDIKRQEYENEQQNVEDLKQKLETIKNQIRVSAETINECDEFLRGIPDIEQLEDERDSLNNKLEVLKERIKISKKEYSSLIRKKTILINTIGEIEETSKLIDNLEKKGSLPPNIDKNLLKMMLDGDNCEICGHQLTESSKEKIKKILNNLEFSSIVSHDLVSIGVSLRGFQTEFKGVLDSIKSATDNLTKLKSDLDSIQKDINSINSKFEVFSDKENIIRKYHERSEHELLRDSNLQLEGVTKAQLDAAQKALEKKKTALDSALNQNGLLEISSKQLKFAEKTRNLALKIENELMNEVKNRIQTKTESIFKNLVWKKNTFDKVILDENFKLNLLHVDGYECLGSSGAAERALFALSFTLAIHQESGFSSPLIIDTPIARISGANRENFAKTLVDVSNGKQIILFLTHDEYSPAVREVIAPFICSSSHLNPVSEKETLIVED